MGDNQGEQSPSLVPGLLGDPVGAVTQKAVASKQNAHKNDEQLARGGVDPAYVTNQEPPPETMTHQQIYDAAHGIDKEALWKLVTTWAKSSVSITSLFQMHRIGIERALQGRWEGASSDAAQQAITRFARAGEQIGDVGQSVGMRLDSMYYAASALAVAVPPPATATAPNPDNPSDSVLPGLTSGEKDRADTTAALAARNQAIDAVNRIYLPIFPPAGENVPALNPPPNVGSGDPSTDTGSPYTQTGYPTGTGTDAHSKQPGDPSAPGQQDPNTPARTDPASTSTPTSPSSTANPVETGKLDTAPTSTPGPTNTSTTPTSVTTGPGDRPIRRDGPNDRGPRIGDRDQPGLRPGTDRPGSPLIGQPGQPGQPVQPGAPVGANAAAAARAAGASTSRSTSPMAPGAPGRRKDDDERTRGVPDYLKRVQPELADLPPMLEGAIGGDHATWQPESETRVSWDSAYTDVQPSSARSGEVAAPRPRTPLEEPGIRYDDSLPSKPSMQSGSATALQAPVTGGHAPAATAPESSRNRGPASPTGSTETEATATSNEDKKPKTVTFTARGPVMDDEPHQETRR
ncbi:MULTISPECIES: hypothetical protein [unclassified Nocardia]|uniref:hypothetical protein n=1 Tax=unclassified Nocardia TaxID=2637762 RepID=UPI001CE4B00B|nr:MULTISPECIES: hypothetical protein [unclassified Nocardia]